MKKNIILWVLLFCFSCCFSVEASTGSLDILIDEKEEFAFTYTKVADYENGEFILKEPFQDSGVNLNEITKAADIRKATDVLLTYNAEKINVETKDQMAQISSLSEGVYLIEGVSNEEYEIATTLVSIPQWDVDGEELSYHVTLIPKIQRVIIPVETGDATKLIPLSMLCALSLIIVVGIAGRAYFLKDK